MVTIVLQLDENETVDLVCILSVAEMTFSSKELRGSASAILDKIKQPVEDIFRQKEIKNV